MEEKYIMPDKLMEQIFEKLHNTAEIAKLTPAQIQSYEDSLKYYRDLKNSLDTAKEEKAIEIAKEMLKENEPLEKIVKYTGLTKEQVEKDKNNIGNPVIIMAQSSIEWTEMTWNPTTGCDKISAGCKFCYAEIMSKRLQAMGVEKYNTDLILTITFTKQLATPYSWKYLKLFLSIQ